MANRVVGIGLCCVFALAWGCDDSAELDAGFDAATLDAGAADSGPGDSGPADAGPTDAGADAGPTDAGADAGPADAGTDAGPSGCRCFGATQIAAVQAHAGSDNQCFTDRNSGTVIDGQLSSADGPQTVQVTVQVIHGFAGTDWFCGAGCVDTNDDTFDDCASAPLGPFGTEVIDEAEHDRCEALIRAACE